jgi:hypothetical protein
MGGRTRRSESFLLVFELTTLALPPIRLIGPFRTDPVKLRQSSRPERL